MKKIVIGVAALIITIIIIIFLGKMGYIKNISHNENDIKDEYDKAIEVLNDTMPTAIFVYGEDIEIREGLQVNKISHITLDSLETENEYVVLILSDLNSNLDITEDEYLVIKEKLKDNKFSLYYLGNSKIQDLKNMGIIETEGSVSGDLCVASVVYYGQRTAWSGLYTENDKVIAEKNNITGRPAEFIFTHLVMCYQSNN